MDKKLNIFNEADVNLDVNGGPTNIQGLLSSYDCVILKPNKKGSKNVLEQWMVASAHTKYIIKYDFDLEDTIIEMPDDAILEIDCGSLQHGTLVGDNTVLINANNAANALVDVTLDGTWSTEPGSDKPAGDGMGKIYLKQGVPLSEQMTKENTIYVVQYDFELDENITVPAGCILDFQGGSISAGDNNADTITFNDTKISDYCFDNIEFSGNYYFANALTVPTNGTKEFVEKILAGVSFESPRPTVLSFSANSIYDWDGVLNIDKRNVTLNGGGTIKGTLKIGLSDEKWNEYGLGTEYGLSQLDIQITNLRFQKIFSLNTSEISSYLINADVDDNDNISLILCNAANVNIVNCQFKDTPFPVVYKRTDGTGYSVRHIYISSCDFDECKVGVKTVIPNEYTPVGNTALIYGDTSIIGCSFMCKDRALDLNLVDGLIFEGCSIYPMSSVSYGIYINKAYEVLINGNNLFGEYYWINTVHAENVKHLNITNNNFGNSWASWKYISTDEEMGCIYTECYEDFANYINISNNVFDGCYRIPIVDFSQGIRTFTIQGNSFTNSNNYLAFFLPMYYVKNDAYTNNFQKRDVTESLYTNIRGYNFDNAIRLNVIDDYIRIKNVEGIPVYRDNKVLSIVKHNVICAIRVEKDSYSSSGYYKFMFDGRDYRVNYTSSDTATTMTDKIYQLLSTDRDDYTFSVIGGIIYAKSTSVDKKPVCGLLLYGQFQNSNVLRQIYCNYGYRIIYRKPDGKKAILSPLASQSLLDVRDKGMMYNDDSYIYAFRPIQISASTKQTLTIPSTVGSSGLYTFYVNDCFFGVITTSSNEDIRSRIKDIADFLYSDVFSTGEGTLTYVEPNIAEPIYAYGISNIAISASTIFYSGWKKVAIDN